MISGSFWNPSRGPTSRIRTLDGRVMNAPLLCFVPSRSAPSSCGKGDAFDESLFEFDPELRVCDRGESASALAESVPAQLGDAVLGHDDIHIGT
jgi:hypothetical protein